MIFRLHYGAVLIIECQQTFVQVLYRLLANSDYIEPLRQEVEAVIREEGWTKAGIDKMFKIDSIIRETQRIDGVSPVARSLDSFPKYEMLIRSPLLSSGPEPHRIAPFHIFQWCDCSRGHVCRCPVCRSDRRENLSKSG
jgi:hypothetical protein